MVNYLKLYSNDCDDCDDYQDNQCHSCVNCLDGSCSYHNFTYTQKLIQKTVRVSSSEYTMNLGGIVSSNNRYNLEKGNPGRIYNPSSDRKQAHVIKPSLNIPRNRTRIAPGMLQPAGMINDEKGGVDIKHNSYARYLARKKGRELRPQVNRNIITDFEKKKLAIVTNNCGNTC